MTENENNFMKDFGLALACVLAIFLFLAMFICSGCKVLKSTKSNVKDSTSVNKVNEGSVRVDSSGSKADRTKETVFYPQPIYIEGKNGESKIIFVPQSVKETEKTEQAQIITDTSWRQAFRELTSHLENKELDKKVKVGPSFIEWILIGGLALLLIKNYIPFKIIKT